MKAPAIVVRPAVPDDDASIAAIHAAAVNGERGAGDYDDRQIDAWTCLRPPVELRERIAARCFFVAERASEPVGYAQLDVGAAVVRSIYVVPDHGRQGIGRLLARAVFAAACAAGLQRVELDSSLNAVPFYEELGCTRLGDVDHRLRDGVVMPCVRMAKQLGDEPGVAAPATMRRPRHMTIAFLADHPEAVPVLADWFAREWGGHGSADTAEDYGKRLPSRANRDRLPICLLGLLDGEPAATATLKFREIEYSETADFWLGSVYVRADVRGNGHGRAITAAAEALALTLRFTPLYLYTPRKESLYGHLGWRTVGRTIADGKQATVMAKDLR